MYAKAADFFFKVQTKILFGFPPVAFLISNRFQCVISQMKENRFLIKFLIYYFLIGVMSFELWSNDCKVTFCAHCRCKCTKWLTMSIYCVYASFYMVLCGDINIKMCMRCKRHTCKPGCIDEHELTIIVLHICGPMTRHVCW